MPGFGYFIPDLGLWGLSGALNVGSNKQVSLNYKRSTGSNKASAMLNRFNQDLLYFIRNKHIPMSIQAEFERLKRQNLQSGGLEWSPQTVSFATAANTVKVKSIVDLTNEIGTLESSEDQIELKIDSWTFSFEIVSAGQFRFTPVIAVNENSYGVADTDGTVQDILTAVPSAVTATKCKKIGPFPTVEGVHFKENGTDYWKAQCSIVITGAIKKFLKDYYTFYLEGNEAKIPQVILAGHCKMAAAAQTTSVFVSETKAYHFATGRA